MTRLNDFARSRLITTVLVVVAALLTTSHDHARAGAVVNCPVDDLQDAIDAAPSGSIVQFTGVCFERIQINKDLTLMGMGDATIDAESFGRAVTVSSATVEIHDVVITGGLSGSGGGLYTFGGTVSLYGSRVTGNHSLGNGGGIYIEPSTSVLTVSDTTVDLNTADHHGGGIFSNGTVTIESSTIADNQVLTAAQGSSGGPGATGGPGSNGSHGGGIAHVGPALTITDSAITGNAAGDGGRGGAGGEGNPAGTGGAGGDGGSGGGIWFSHAGIPASLDITDTEISGNAAGAGGRGGIGGTGVGIFQSGDGGEGGDGGDGGGVHVEYPPLTIGGSTVADNDTGDAGPGGFPGLVDGGPAGSMGAPGSQGRGGGLHLTQGTDLTLSNSTVSGNAAFLGGGLWAEDFSSMALDRVTFAANETPSGQTEAFYHSNLLGPGGTIGRSIIEGSCESAASKVDSTGFNVFGTACANVAGHVTDRFGDPGIAPLADNGGPTDTHALLPSSPAVDNIPFVACGGVVDQRGFLRGPVGDDCDSGAYELALCRGLAADRVGTAGDDVIDGDGGDNVILALAGNDLIRAAGGDDTICAGGGDDVVKAGGGADWVDGGEGADTIRGQAGDDVLKGGDGEDRVLGGGGADVVKGGKGDDVVKGQPGDDVVRGQTDDDTVTGGAGEDRVLGGSGNDKVRGQRDDDVAKGQSGADIVTGGHHDDVLRGGGGDDVLRGQKGDDRLFGQSGTDTANGGAGTDRCDAESESFCEL